MAEKKGVGHAYNVDFLNVVFAASSLFLFLSVIWMVWDDFDRDWKNTQRAVRAARDGGDAGASSQQASGGGRRNQAARSSGAAPDRRTQERRGEPAEGRRAAGQARRHRRAPLPRDAGLPVRQGDLRSGPLRLRGRSARRAIQRGRAEGQAVTELGDARQRAEPDRREDRRPSGRRSARSSSSSPASGRRFRSRSTS